MGLVWKEASKNHDAKTPGRYRWKASIRGPFSGQRAGVFAFAFKSWLEKMVGAVDVKTYVSKPYFVDKTETTEITVAWSVLRKG